MYAAAHRPPNVPATLTPYLAAAAAAPATPGGGARAALPPGKLLLAADVDVRALAIRGQSVAIVGGGMTSAALALAALDAGAAQARWVPMRVRSAVG